MPGPLDKTQNTTHSPILFPPVSTPSHNCQALVPSPVVLDPIPNQSKIQVQLGLGVTLKSHGPPQDGGQVDQVDSEIKDME